MLDDLKYCLENENISSVQDWTHFLGSFVFEKNQKDNKLVVIDGQQRLTTIIIMLCAICVLFNEAGEQDRFNGVTKYILGTDDLGKPYSRVGNADLSNFQLLVDEATSYNSLQSKSSLFQAHTLFLPLKITWILNSVLTSFIHNSLKWLTPQNNELLSYHGLKTKY